MAGDLFSLLRQKLGQGYTSRMDPDMESFKISFPTLELVQKTLESLEVSDDKTRSCNRRVNQFDKPGSVSASSAKQENGAQKDDTSNTTEHWDGIEVELGEHEALYHWENGAKKVGSNNTAEHWDGLEEEVWEDKPLERWENGQVKKDTVKTAEAGHGSEGQASAGKTLDHGENGPVKEDTFDTAEQGDGACLVEGEVLGDKKSNSPKKREMFNKHDPAEMASNNKVIFSEFQEKQSSAEYQEMQAERQKLPVWDMRHEITQLVEDNQVVIISGMTGCGKTTQVPQFLLDKALMSESFKTNIVCTQPRRVSAMSVAERVANERVEQLGISVGYQIRLEGMSSTFTRILFCTTGIILRRLEGDWNIDGVTHIIIDEVHERTVESDFLLLIVKDMLERRPDLKVILMSATMNAQLFSDYFGGCPVIEIPGRMFDVRQLFLEDVIEFTNDGRILKSLNFKDFTTHNLMTGLATLIQYLCYKIGNDSKYARSKSELYNNYSSSYRATSAPISETIPDSKLSALQLKSRYSSCSSSTVHTLSTMNLEEINFDLVVDLIQWIVKGSHDFPSHGAVLVFLPGYQEIQTVYDQLLGSVQFRDTSRYKIIPLHSTLSSDEQYSVFAPPAPGVTKIVLSTNIAETSITIDDVVYIVDVGKVKETRYDQTKSMESLDLVWVSKTNAVQRMGRAGRVKDGVCFHLFTSNQYHHHLREQQVPEIQRTCLEQLVIRTKVLSVFKSQVVGKILERLIEAPTPDAVTGAVQRLTDLGALDANEELTPLGYHVGSLPVDVRIGKLMLFGAIFRCLDSTLTIAATLSFKSPFYSPFNKKEEATKMKKEFAKQDSDHLTMLNAYKKWCKVRGSRGCYNFCRDNFLSYKTLQMLCSLKQQYVELLSDIGFIRPGIRLRDVIRVARDGSDGVAEITGPEANVNNDNSHLLSAMLVAALYPNIIKVVSSSMSRSGLVKKFRTKSNEYVNIHPSSVNFRTLHFLSPYLVYHEKVKTTKVYIRDCSVVSTYPLLLFAGGQLDMKTIDRYTVLYVDELIQFKTIFPKTAEVIKKLRFELDQLLADKISQPEMDLLTSSRGKKIIDCIVEVIKEV